MANGKEVIDLMSSSDEDEDHGSSVSSSSSSVCMLLCKPASPKTIPPLSTRSTGKRSATSKNQSGYVGKENAFRNSKTPIMRVHAPSSAAAASCPDQQSKSAKERKVSARRSKRGTKRKPPHSSPRTASSPSEAAAAAAAAAASLQHPSAERKKKKVPNMPTKAAMRTAASAQRNHNNKTSSSRKPMVSWANDWSMDEEEDEQSLEEISRKLKVRRQRLHAPNPKQQEDADRLFAMQLSERINKLQDDDREQPASLTPLGDRKRPALSPASRSKRQREEDSTADRELALRLQDEDDENAKKRAKLIRDQQEKSMNDHVEGRAVQIVRAVLATVPANIPGVSAVGEDDIVFMMMNFLTKQEVMRLESLDTNVDIGFHYTDKVNLPKIRQDGLLSRVDRQARKIASAHQHGAVFGEGIYTSDNYTYFAPYGDTLLILARLKGKAVRFDLSQQPENKNATTIIGNKEDGSATITSHKADEVVLLDSSQCVPLVYVDGNVARNKSSHAMIDDLVQDLKTRVIAVYCNSAAAPPGMAPTTATSTSAKMANATAPVQSPPSLHASALPPWTLAPPNTALASATTINHQGQPGVVTAAGLGATAVAPASTLPPRASANNVPPKTANASTATATIPCVAGGVLPASHPKITTPTAVLQVPPPTRVAAGRSGAASLVVPSTTATAKGAAAGALNYQPPPSLPSGTFPVPRPQFSSAPGRHLTNAAMLLVPAPHPGTSSTTTTAAALTYLRFQPPATITGGGATTVRTTTTAAPSHPHASAAGTGHGLATTTVCSNSERSTHAEK